MLYCYVRGKKDETRVRKQVCERGRKKEIIFLIAKNASVREGE